MSRVGKELFVSSVEVNDRERAQGKAHLFRMTLEGRLIGRLDLTDAERYHPGGIDYDGTRLWVPVAEYRPDSTSAVYVVDPRRMRSRVLFRFPDHLGAIVHDADHGTLIAMSWGSRKFYQWQTQLSGEEIEVSDPEKATMTLNPAHYVDFQDAQWIPGTSRMLCGGLKRYPLPAPQSGQFALSGLELFDTGFLSPVVQAAVPLWDAAGRPMLQNPFHVELSQSGLRVYFMPADNESTIYVYETKSL
jgi:hypothetical protein